MDLHRTCQPILFAALLVWIIAWGSTPEATSADDDGKTAGRFQNLYPFHKPGLASFLKWRWERIGKNIGPPESDAFPLAANDPDFLRRNRSETTATWIGHATLLLQLGGVNILTDPIFSDRASPVQWAGPRRVAPPGLAMIDLPPIDVVLISHSHYDSLDLGTVQALATRPGGTETVFFVPLGLKQWFRSQGIDNVVELDWWAQKNQQGLEIQSVPAQHWSKRTLLTQ
ncbi:MAG: MBL fold metallo-hydrolase, partial [Chrysiogenales bacterium]